MDDYRQKVHVLIKTQALKMGFSEPNSLFCDGVYEECIKYGLHAIEDTIASFRKLPIKSFPKLGEIIEKMELLEKNKSHDSYKDLRCKFYEKNESTYSKELCSINVFDKYERQKSIQLYGKLLCTHHQKRTNAISNPNLQESIDFKKAMREGESRRVKCIEMGVIRDNYSSISDWLEDYYKKILCETPPPELKYLNNYKFG